MKIISLKGEDASGSCVVVCVRKHNRFTGKTTRFFETFFFYNTEDIQLYLLFDACDKCRVKGYEILKRFGRLLYSGIEFKEAMKARI